MAFSLIITFMINQRYKFNKFQYVALYELSQKYIYYISAKAMTEKEEKIKNNNNELLLEKKREEELKEYFFILKIAYKVKYLIINYIDNELKILKNKYLFEDSLSFQFDENNGNIISVKSNFFIEKIKYNKIYLNNKNKKNKKENKYSKETNLYFIISLLKMEKFFFQKIINSINQIDFEKEIPIFIIFKYFLFFDFFEGGKIPIEIGNRLYHSLTNSPVLYNGIIKNSDFSILKRKYNEKNNQINSKFFSIYEFKREIKTKYFSENIALKLGYKQKEIINVKMDILIPTLFAKSHENVVKQAIIENQIKYNNYKEKFYFNKSKDILYPASLELSLIYNISKSLIVIIKSNFMLKNEYIFMLDINFELIANTKNFEDEFYLNQRLLKIYDIKIMNILRIKPNKLYKEFSNEFNKIQYQKCLGKIKPEGFFTPQFYEVINQNLYNYSNISTKMNIISKLLNLKQNKTELNDNKLDDENNNFIQKNNNKKSISDLFICRREVVFHKIFYKSINKGSFINNISKALIKISDNDLMLENDKSNYNLIMASKKLIANLMTKNELLDNSIRYSIKFSFYYDKPFYLIKIYDEKKLYLKISKTINFKYKNQNIIPFSSGSTTKSFKNIISYNNDKKYTSIIPINPISNTNNVNILEDIKIIKNGNNATKDNNNRYDIDKEKIKVLSKIDDIRIKINRDKFIVTIRLVLVIFIIFILVIYSVIFFSKIYNNCLRTNSFWTLL